MAFISNSSAKWAVVIVALFVAGCAHDGFPSRQSANLATALPEPQSIEFLTNLSIDSAELVPLVQGLFGVRAYASGNNTLVLRGNRSDVDRAYEMVHHLDESPISSTTSRIPMVYTIRHAKATEVAVVLREMVEHSFFAWPDGDIDGHVGIAVDERLNLLLLSIDRRNEAQIRDIISHLDREPAK